MLQEYYGAEIDDCVVVRMKDCRKTLGLPKQYGTRTDYMSASLGTAKDLPRIVPDCKYWAFVDSRMDEVSEKFINHQSETVPCTILKGLCDEWNAAYRVRRTPYDAPKGIRIYDPLGHPHVSAGFHTILYAAELLEPEKIVLYGFDSMKAGAFTWSVTRGPAWLQYPDHHWQVEHDMIPLVEKSFDVEIEYR